MTTRTRTRTARRVPTSVADTPHTATLDGLVRRAGKSADQVPADRFVPPRYRRPPAPHRLAHSPSVRTPATTEPWNGRHTRPNPADVIPVRYRAVVVWSPNTAADSCPATSAEPPWYRRRKPSACGTTTTTTAAGRNTDYHRQTRTADDGFPCPEPTWWSAIWNNERRATR